MGGKWKIERKFHIFLKLWMHSVDVLNCPYGSSLSSVHYLNVGVLQDFFMRNIIHAVHEMLPIFWRIPSLFLHPRTFIWHSTLDFKHFIENLFLQILVESRTFTPKTEITFLFTSLPLSTHFPVLFNKGLLYPASYLFSFTGHTPCHVGSYFTDHGGWYPSKIPFFSGSMES